MELSASEKFQIERINQISLMARTTWFGLLAYLAFVGITLLAVEDADFFVPSRQTHLPLINVAIPTRSFFWFAPILGTALYAYLHLQLLKLWDALAAPAPRPGHRPLADHVYPWLINDFALTYRRDGAIRRRPLVFLSTVVTRLLVWIAGPFVLAGFWIRSMPAHNEWLTLAIAVCLGTAVYIGLTTWWRAAKRLTRDPGTPWSGWWKRPLGVALLILTLVSSWVVTEGGFDHYANQVVSAWNDARKDDWMRTCALRRVIGAGAQDPAPPRTCLDRRGRQRDLEDLDTIDRLRIQERHVADRWWGFSLERLTFDTDDTLIGFFLGEDEEWTTLAPTNLAGVDLVARPGGLLEYDVHRRRFRSDWCGRQGLSPAVCGPVPDSTAAPPPHQAPARAGFCEPIGDAACTAFFAGLEDRFATAWRDERAAKLAALPDLPLAGADLRGADMGNAFLARADLTGARMEGAVLRGARMEGADLSAARMEGADLREARMEGAVLRGARMEGAVLRWARMEGAVLRWARMEGADLREARMGGSDCTSAAFLAALVQSADFNCRNLQRRQLQYVVGDPGTRLPPGLTVWSCLDRGGLRKWTRLKIDLKILRHPEQESPFKISRAQFRDALFCDRTSAIVYRRDQLPMPAPVPGRPH